MRIEWIAAAVAAVLWFGASPAAAVADLTGTYEMKLSCKGQNGGVKGKFKVEDPFYVVDEGTGVVRFETGQYGPGRAFLLTVTAKPDTGTLSGMTCGKNAADLDGLVIRLDVNSKPADPVLKGTLFIFEEPSSQSGTCKFSAKRVSLKVPKIVACAM